MQMLLMLCEGGYLKNEAGFPASFFYASFFRRHGPAVVVGMEQLLGALA